MEIRNDVSLPALTGTRAGSKELYGFSRLTAPTVGADGSAIYDSFGVMKPRLKIRSTVYAAAKRLGDGRKFLVVDVDPLTDPDNAIARVFRIA